MIICKYILVVFCTVFLLTVNLNRKLSQAIKTDLEQLPVVASNVIDIKERVEEIQLQEKGGFQWRSQSLLSAFHVLMYNSDYTTRHSEVAVPVELLSDPGRHFQQPGVRDRWLVVGLTGV
jgi:hypothetical protein